MLLLFVVVVVVASRLVCEKVSKTFGLIELSRFLMCVCCCEQVGRTAWWVRKFLRLLALLNWADAWCVCCCCCCEQVGGTGWWVRKFPRLLGSSQVKSNKSLLFIITQSIIKKSKNLLCRLLMWVCCCCIGNQVGGTRRCARKLPRHAASLSRFLICVCCCCFCCGCCCCRQVEGTGWCVRKFPRLLDSDQIKQVFILHHYTKHKNDLFFFFEQTPSVSLLLWAGRRNKAVCEKVPKTCSLIEQIPDARGCKRGQVMCRAFIFAFDASDL